MLEAAERFKVEMLRRLDGVTEGRDAGIREAGPLMADTAGHGGIIRAFGSDRGHVDALGICGRSGGYAQTKIAQEPALGI